MDELGVFGDMFFDLATCAWGSAKWPGCYIAYDGADSDATCGEATGTAGGLGIGKLASSC